MRPSRSGGTDARGRAERYGRHGESLAAWYLRAKLYRIVERRVKTPVGEIDLVARRFGVTAFVEVKARRAGDGELEALQAVNQRRIVQAAEYYVARHPALTAAPLRFDVIFLAPLSWPRHVMNAFDAS
ncbi:MAG TPA: YraN family protein [Devosiaceae bacterium]|jgi:putative endonuclease|nr:YraN family protein [Devosiaceae bacterium]